MTCGTRPTPTSGSPRGTARARRRARVPARPALCHDRGSSRYLNLYEVDHLATLTSKPYLDRLNDPSPWTRRVVPGLRNNIRTLCEVIASHGGRGVCGLLLTAQIAAQADEAGALRAWLDGEALPGLVERPGIIGTHLLRGNQTASRTPAEEKRLRGGADGRRGLNRSRGRLRRQSPAGRRDDVLSAGKLTSPWGAKGSAKIGLDQILHPITEPNLG